jgi:demethylspheroidene O-methyltransferase
LIRAWQGLRDRLLASEAFHGFAIRFPLTRWIARRQAKSLFDLVAGFVYSQVLFACVRLDLFALLAKGPLGLEDLASRLRLSTDATDRLMRAAASLQLVESRSGQRWGLGMQGAVLAGNTAVTALIEHHATLYADLRDPVALLRGETDPHLARYWPYADERAASPTLLPEARVKEYSELMSASQPLIAQEVLSAYAFRNHRYLLDVGGGQGTFLLAAARAFPHLRLMLFDLPAVAGLADKNFRAAGLAERAQAHGGSFFESPLPSGADLITVLRVLYDHDDHRALAILQAAYRALAPGGTLLVAEPMSETPGAESMGSAYFGFYLLAMGKGKSRSAQRLMQLIYEAGFRDPRLRATRLPLQVGLIVAKK